MSLQLSARKVVPWIVVGVALAAVGAVALRGFNKFEHPPQVFDPEHDPGALVKLAPGQTDTLQFAPNAISKMGYRLATVEQAPPPPPLRLLGKVELDQNSMVRVKPRFTGRVVEIGQFLDPQTNKPIRSLRYGDNVRKGQVLAVIWSTEVGAKKSELVDALCKLKTNKNILERLEGAQKGAIAELDIINAKRDYQQATVAEQNARRTLLSWGILEKDIEAVYREAEKLESRKLTDIDSPEDLGDADLAVEKRWANTELLAPIDGQILEKNFNESDQVDPSDDLFKIVDTSHIRILARVFEDDLPLLRHLSPEKRQWKIDLKADPFDEPVAGKFEIVGGIIDPADHTGAVIGTLNNAGGRMNLGQFVTAAIDLDADPAMVSVPAKSVIESGSLATIFVQNGARPDEFTRRLVAITSRLPGKVCVRSEPTAEERAAGASSLHKGECVLASGVPELDAELTVLKNAQPPSQARAENP